MIGNRFCENLNGSSEEPHNEMQNITCEDINKLLKLLCQKEIYVSLSIDIHDGEIKQLETVWKTRGKEEIVEFMKKFRKDN